MSEKISNFIDHFLLSEKKRIGNVLVLQILIVFLESLFFTKELFRSFVQCLYRTEILLILGTLDMSLFGIHNSPFQRKKKLMKILLRRDKLCNKLYFREINNVIDILAEGSQKL